MNNPTGINLASFLIFCDLTRNSLLSMARNI